MPNLCCVYGGRAPYRIKYLREIRVGTESTTQNVLTGKGYRMTRTQISGAAVALLLVGTATQGANAAAHNPLIVWQGAAELTSLTAACSKLGLMIGDVGVSVFRPRLDPAEPSSAITMTLERSGMAFFRTGGTSTDQMQGTSNYTSPWYSGRATSTPGGNTGAITLAITPSAITTATDQIMINGMITNFFGTAGCTAKFNASYRQRTN